MGCNDNTIGRGHLTSLSGHSNCTSELGVDSLLSKASTSQCTSCLGLSPVKIEALMILDLIDLSQKTLIAECTGGLEQIFQPEVRYPFWRLHR